MKHQTRRKTEAHSNAQQGEAKHTRTVMPAMVRRCAPVQNSMSSSQNPLHAEGLALGMVSFNVSIACSPYANVESLGQAGIDMPKVQRL